MKNLKFILLLMATFGFIASEAQVGSYFTKFRPSKKWSVGLQLSPTVSNGDADAYAPGFSGGLHVKYSVSQAFGLKLSGNIGSLKGGRDGQDFSLNNKGSLNGTTTPDGIYVNAGNQAPSEDSYEFTNKFKDLDLVAVYTLGNLSFLRPLRKVQMFTFFGIGSVWSDVTGTYTDQTEAQSYYKAWGTNYFTGYDAAGVETTTLANVATAETRYIGNNFTIPFGVGFKRNFGSWLDLGLEWRTHWTRSDNLDGFSFPVWRNRYADFYSLLGVQASVKLGAKGQNEHYDWLNPMETLYADMEAMKVTTDKLKTLAEDADGDGVGDFFDTEADTDCDRVYANGKAMDSDKDGINDCKDKELFSICDDVDADGVAKDSDGDGVPDCLDEEPNTPAGKLVDVRGNEYKMNNGGGCCDCDNVTLPTIIFENGSSKIAPSSYGVLYAVAEKMKQCPGLSISATGYTTSKSGEQLAWKRSNAIIDHLETNYGIERSRVSVGYSNSGGVEYSTRRIDLLQSGR